MKYLGVSSVLVVSWLFVGACSSAATTGDAGAADAATADATSPVSDAGADGSVVLPVKDAESDVATPKPVRCTDAELAANDFTTFPGVDISFFGASPAQYTNPCVTTKVGDTVTFASDFTMHPLEPAGGDTPSFIPATATGDTLAVVPTTPGTYGFQCSAHPGIMFGAVRVVAK